MDCITAFLINCQSYFVAIVCLEFASDEFLRGGIGWELEHWREPHKQLQADTLLVSPYELLIPFSSLTFYLHKFCE